MKKMTKTEIKSAYAKALRSRELAKISFGFSKVANNEHTIAKHNLDGRYEKWDNEVKRLEALYPWLLA